MPEFSYNLQNKKFPPAATPEDIEENWLWAVVSYLGPLFLLVFSLRRESAFATYHARQGRALFIASLLWLIFWIVANFLVPAGVRFALLALTGISILGFLLLFALWLEGMAHAIRGEMKPLTWIGTYVEE